MVLPLILSACQSDVMNPAGDIAKQQAHLVIVATLLMLIIVVPVMLLIVLFAWRYRASSAQAPYAPEWHHSTQLELLIWAAPLLIIIALGAMTWISTHQLDPFRPLDRLKEGQRPIAAGDQAAGGRGGGAGLEVAVHLPRAGRGHRQRSGRAGGSPDPFQDHRLHGDELVLRARPLPGMIYAMPGMTTQLNAVINKPGGYEGLSANYSGAGFSHMRFKFRAGREPGRFRQVGRQGQG
ncbi:hypothetical protein [Novosphingobium sp.]|uniref:hypothetical protein n=1 Tax=Novosphingobium sp. TaxID=1874826 RepID=UPI0031D06B22